MSQINYVTKETFEELQAELYHMKSVLRPAAARAIGEAREKGDLRENVQSMLKLGRAQGVAIAAAMQAGLTVTEYSPRKIKQSITGNGNSDKQQVLKMLQRIVNFSEEPKYFDATDALAVAVCHHFQGNSLSISSNKKLTGWNDFLAKNPERLKSKV